MEIWCARKRLTANEYEGDVMTSLSTYVTDYGERMLLERESYDDVADVIEVTMRLKSSRT